MHVIARMMQTRAETKAEKERLPFGCGFELLATQSRSARTGPLLRHLC